MVNNTVIQSHGVYFDQTWSFNAHIKEVTNVAFFHLRNIAKIWPILLSKDPEVLIHAFITSHIDYCNVLLSGLRKKSFQAMQMVQNAAAYILTRAGKYKHITPVLASLRWLPVQVRADLKVLLLT